MVSFTKPLFLCLSLPLTKLGLLVSFRCRRVWFPQVLLPPLLTCEGLFDFYAASRFNGMLFTTIWPYCFKDQSFSQFRAYSFLLIPGFSLKISAFLVVTNLRSIIVRDTDLCALLYRCYFCLLSMVLLLSGLHFWRDVLAFKGGFQSRSG